jgi:uncharacterized protein YndB with AHSA1/START domain
METGMKFNNPPVAKTGMLIRKPIASVFEAIVDPAITSRFWFTKGSGRLEPGAQVRWDWEMYDVHADVRVIEFEPDRRILMEWGAAGEAFTTVEWELTPLTGDTTFLSVTNSGFSGDGDEIVTQAIDSMGGFTLVVAGLKAFLEHGIELNLVGDRFPKGIEK